jgi:hypothetical protein
MVRELPIIIYKKKEYFVDFREGELRDVKTAKPIRFVNLKEGVDSPIKKSLRRLRFQTWANEYIRGVDD